jgi:hypothetical protein
MQIPYSSVFSKDSPDGIKTVFKCYFNSIGTIFYNIKTDNLSDLKHLKSIKSLPSVSSAPRSYFYNTKRIDIPENVTSLGRYVLGFNLATVVVFHGKTPPSHDWTFSNTTGTYDTCTPNGCKFYVPDESLEVYKKAFTSKPSPLSGTSIIHPMSELHE